MHYKKETLNETIEPHDKTFPSVEKMDYYFDSLAAKIDSTIICDAVNRFFGIDVDRALLLHPGYVQFKQPRTAIDNYLQQYGNMQGSQIRLMIKELFGINLSGIAELHKDRISLYSKDQWIVKHNKSLFHVHTGKNDVDVKILPTSYFTRRTGLTELPEILQQALAPLGYSYNREEHAYYYCDPNGHPVSGQFKVHTMKTIAKIVHQYYAHL